MAAIVAGVSSAVGGIASPMRASAAYAQCDTPSNYHEGYIAGTSNMTQVNAVEGINTYQYLTGGNYCTIGDTDPTSNFIMAWSMAQDANANGYAQSGIIARYGDNCMHYFAEQKQSSAYTALRSVATGCAPTGQTHQIWQQLIWISSANCYHYRSNIDGLPIMETNYCPLNGNWQLPLAVFMSGETRYNNSDVPGYSSSKTDWSGVQVQSWFNDNFYGACDSTYGIGFSGVTASRYSESAVSCNEFQSWTS